MDKKRIQINFRLTEAENTKLQVNAYRAGLTPSMYAKKMAIEGKVKPQIISPDEAKEITSQLGKIGSNLNQVARKLNSNMVVERKEFVVISKGINELWDYILEGKKPKKQKSIEQKLEEKTGQKELDFTQSDKNDKVKDGENDGVCKSHGKSQSNSGTKVW